MVARLSALFLLAAVLAGCSAPAAPVDPLSGTSWVLVSLDGAAPLPGTTIALRFRDGRARGRMGCNELDGPYRVVGSTLRLHEIAQSAMACEDEAVMRQEQEFSTAMRLTATFVLEEGRTLALQDAAGETRLVFRPAS